MTLSTTAFKQNGRKHVYLLQEENSGEREDNNKYLLNFSRLQETDKQRIP